MDIGIVVATKNRAGVLDKMLTSLSEAMGGNVTHEVIAIDGDSQDNTRQILQEHKVDKIFRESECMEKGRHDAIRPGYHSWGELYNFGFKQTDAAWLMFCSDDIIFNKDCFIYAMRILRNQPEAVAGGMFYYKTHPSDDLFIKFGIDYTYGHYLMLNYGLVRSKSFWEVGGLNEHYVFYCADGDLSLSLYKAGKVLLPLPECLVTHYKGMDEMATMHMAHSNKDIAEYKYKWQGAADKAGLEPRRLWLETGMSHENP